MEKMSAEEAYKAMESIDELVKAISAELFVLVRMKRGLISATELQKETVKNSVRELNTVLSKIIDDL